MGKELEKITNILNKYLKPFDCEAVSGTDFAYYPNENVISYALAVIDNFEESFIKFAESLHPDVHADIFLWSLFHELGHHETEDEFDDEDEVQYLKLSTICKDDWEYYNIPQEKAATDWAGWYMETHAADVGQLWNDLAPAIQDFYKAMEVM